MLKKEFDLPVDAVSNKIGVLFVVLFQLSLLQGEGSFAGDHKPLLQGDEVLLLQLDELLSSEDLS